jgi:hypothetical protein
MKYVKMIPLFFYLLVAYNGMAVLGHPGHELALQTRWMAFPLISGREFLLNGGDVLLILGVGALYFEILKSTANTVATIIDHMASMLIFVVYLVEFIVVPAAGTSVFFYFDDDVTAGCGGWIHGFHFHGTA